MSVSLSHYWHEKANSEKAFSLAQLPIKTANDTGPNRADDIRL
jgi:hypothetical protein